MERNKFCRAELLVCPVDSWTNCQILVACRKLAVPPGCDAPGERGKNKGGQSSGSHQPLDAMVALRSAVVLAALLLSSSLIATEAAGRSLSVVSDPSGITSAEVRPTQLS